MISLVISHTPASGKARLYEARLELTGAKVLPEYQRDFALIVTESHFTETDVERQRHLGTLFNAAWVGECLQEYHVGSFTLTPIETGTPEVMLVKNEPAATPAGLPLVGYRQACAMFLDWYAAPRQRIDSRDYAFIGMGYVAARLAAQIGLSGQPALDAVTNAIIALSAALELDETMPLGYLDPLLANGALGFTGLLSGTPHWVASDGFSIPTLQRAADMVDEAFLRLCADIDPDILQPAADDEISAHDALRAEAFRGAVAPFITHQLVEAMRELGCDLKDTFPKEAA